MSESVELATILMTDLVGSTRLASSVGPVRADRLRDEHFELLREAIDASGGLEVKNLGDGLMVAFSSASAAVRCAVRIQELFERRYRRAEQRLHVRVGLAAGEATIKDGDYFGMPSIEAARLCDRAAPDGILASASVRMLAGRSEGVEFESVGQLELKGFPDAVEAFAVKWTLAEDESGAGRWPLPAVLRSVPSISFVGREPERALIEQGRDSVCIGERRLIAISGEPGIGKSRLAAYAARGAHAEGFAVCWGACSEELAVPYEPWIEVCTGLVADAPQALLESYVDRHGGEISRLARNLRARVRSAPAPQESDPETERFLLFSAVAGLLTVVSASTPVCVVLDDLQWGDAQSVALVKHLARAREQMRLQMIITFRDSDLGKDHPLSAALADLRLLDGVQRLGLRGLDADDVTKMLAVAAGHELDAEGLDLAERIATETDGNPFFVTEVMRSLLEAGSIVYDEESGRWRLDRSMPLGLPESVREVIERRVARLGNKTREALTIAAVIGRTFDLELVAMIVDYRRDRLLDHLEGAVAASLLAESAERIGRFRFAHALINQTLYQGLGPTRRAQMHHRVAQALEELYGADPAEHLSELALHWSLATTAVESHKAAGYAYRAGRRALDDLAPAEAARLFGVAIELLDERATDERCRALIGLGDAQRLTGDAAYRLTLLEASRIAATLADPELSASAALANSRGFNSVVGKVDQERLDAIAVALELDDHRDPGRRARLLALQAMELGWAPPAQRATATMDEALNLARETREPRTVAEVLRNLFYADWSPATLDRRVALSAELTEAAAAAKDPALAFWALEIERIVSVEQGRIPQARAAARQQEGIVRELGQPLLTWLATYSSAALELLRGNLDVAEQLAARAFGAGQEAGQETDAALIYGAQLARIKDEQGGGELIVERLERSVAAYPFITAMRAGLACVYAGLGRRAEATAIVEDAMQDSFAGVPWDSTRLTTLALLTSAVFDCELAEPAAILFGLIEPWADQVVFNNATSYGHARLWLGMLAATLGRAQPADELLGFACDFHEQNGMLLWAAHSHVAWAQALVTRGDGAHAAGHAERALELARAHGYRGIEARATAILVPGAAT